MKARFRCTWPSPGLSCSARSVSALARAIELRVVLDEHRRPGHRIPQHRVRLRKLGIARDGLLEQLRRPVGVLPRGRSVSTLSEEELPLQERVIGLDIRRAALTRPGLPVGGQPQAQLRDEPFGDLILDREDVAGPHVEAIGPDRCAIVEPQQVHADAQAVALALPAALEHGVDELFLRGGQRIGVGGRIAAHGAGRAHGEPAGLADPRDDRVRDAEADVVLLQVARQRLERQHGQSRDAAAGGTAAGTPIPRA